MESGGRVRTKTVRFATVAAGILLAVVPAFAHHGDAAYDMTKLVTVKGTVSDFQFTNPHAEVFITVKDADGKVEQWKGEMTSPNMLTRRGWTRSTLKPGEEVTLIGYRAKDGTTSLWLKKVIAGKGKNLYPTAGENKRNP